MLAIIISRFHVEMSFYIEMGHLFENDDNLANEKSLQA